MTVNLRTVFRFLGILLFVLGLCAVPPLLVAVIADEKLAARCFFIMVLACLACGGFIIRFFPLRGRKILERDGYLIVALSWITASLIGAVPFYASGAIPSFIDAFFETASGFSTTGSSILSDIESLPRSMLFWRSFTHWMGGMGIIVLGTALLPALGIQGQKIANAETPGPTLDKITARFSENSRRLYLLYLGFTVAETVLLLFGGMDLYDALVHTFGTVGTGGFSNYSDSIAHFPSVFVQVVILVFMFLCGTNFNLFFAAAKHGPRAFRKDDEFRMYLGILLVCTGLITIDLLVQGGSDDPGHSLLDSAFQVTSVMTTTGYATADYDLWPTFSKCILLIVFLTGACSSSTGGGAKIIRIVVAVKLVRRLISKKLHPQRVFSIKVNGKSIEQETVTNITNFLLFYIFVFFAGCLLIALNGFDMMTTFSSVLTCLGNVGPGFALVGPSCNFALFSPFSKLLLSLLMIAGRLELFTFFLLFSPHYWNANKR